MNDDHGNGIKLTTEKYNQHTIDGGKNQNDEDQQKHADRMNFTKNNRLSGNYNGSCTDLTVVRDDNDTDDDDDSNEMKMIMIPKMMMMVKTKTTIMVPKITVIIVT